MSEPVQLKKTQLHTHARMHTRTHALRHTHTHTHTHAYTYICTCMHTNAHTYTHTHTYLLMHVTHTCPMYTIIVIYVICVFPYNYVSICLNITQT